MWQEEVKKKLASIGKSLYLPQRKKKEPKTGKGVGPYSCVSRQGG
jgi:hypothetical protein